jgi:hypothetical protein
MVRELDHLAGQQLQRPSRPARRRPGVGSRHQHRLLLAGELARRPGTRFFAEGRFQVAFDEPPLRPIHRRPADRNAGSNILVAHPSIGRQQDLRPLQLARGGLAPAHQRRQLLALGLAQVHPVTHIHDYPLNVEAKQMNQIPGSCPPSCGPSFTPKQGQYLAFILAYTRALGRPP